MASININSVFDKLFWFVLVFMMLCVSFLFISIGLYAVNYDPPVCAQFENGAKCYGQPDGPIEKCHHKDLGNWSNE